MHDSDNDQHYRTDDIDNDNDKHYNNYRINGKHVNDNDNGKHDVQYTYKHNFNHHEKPVQYDEKHCNKDVNDDSNLYTYKHDDHAYTASTRTTRTAMKHASTRSTMTATFYCKFTW